MGCYIDTYDKGGRVRRGGACALYEVLQYARPPSFMCLSIAGFVVENCIVGTPIYTVKEHLHHVLQIIF